MQHFPASSLIIPGLASAVLLGVCLAFPSPAAPATLQAATAELVQEPVRCDVDLTSAGQMSDIVSNALCRGLNQRESEIRAFLDGAEKRYPDGQALLVASAKHFGIAEADLAREVERFHHCNCSHPGGELWERAQRAAGPFELTQFASDVTLHVVLHELGHALVREFDLPILGNEETLADAFATHYLTTYLPDRAVAVLAARTQSLMVEAGEVPREDWTVGGEHNSDARRAFQIAALAYAADPAKYRSVADGIGMSEGEMRGAADYGTEIHRSWRRILAPLWMPEGTASNEARFALDSDGQFAEQIRSSDLPKVLRATLQRFDWHSQVSIRFVEGEGGAGWSRSKRTITVNSAYVQRFVGQGRQLQDAAGR